jgi:hypothetical protein
VSGFKKENGGGRVCEQKCAEQNGKSTKNEKKSLRQRLRKASICVERDNNCMSGLSSNSLLRAGGRYRSISSFWFL